MPYFIYCQRCNIDGLYNKINQECPKCDGTGHDWRDDTELEDYHKWSGLKLNDLIREKTLISENGTKFFYRDTIPSIQEEKLQIKFMSLSKSAVFKQGRKLNTIYDNYIEPCQLCISRKGITYDSCGWCHDTDTHYKTTDKTYAGDWVKLPYKGDGYPFHEIPHPTRKYFLNGKYIEGSEGLIPIDVTENDIKEAIERNEAVSGLIALLDPGICVEESEGSIPIDVTENKIKEAIERNESPSGIRELQDPGVYMDLNTFDKYATEGKCPLCEGTNLSQKKDSDANNTLIWCNTCRGYPANCNSQLYLHSKNNVLDCEVCGEKRAPAKNHGILCLW